MAPFIAMCTALITAPLIAIATQSRYYIALEPVAQDPASAHQCVICENHFEVADVAHCPAYAGTICSLCCSLDAHCNDRCKPQARLSFQLHSLGNTMFPAWMTRWLQTDVGHYLIMLLLFSGVLAGVLSKIYFLELPALMHAPFYAETDLREVFIKLFATLFLMTGIDTWWLVLTAESRGSAQQESEQQTNLLLTEIDVHQLTDRELQRTKDAADASNMAKSRFVTGMSHELRTPLNSIPPHRLNAISVIRRSGEHLLSLIDGMLDIARIEAGKMRLESAELPLREFLDEIVQMVAPQAAQKGLGFHFIEAGRIPSAVHADEKRLRQILINLLANTVKFTDAGAVTLRVTYAREIAKFELEDTGISIAQEDIERIFLPFERSKSASVQQEVGTGLGLAISNMLVHIIGGELSVTSQAGKGSTFKLRMYLREVRQPLQTTTNAAQTTGYIGARKRVLIVDDQASQRIVLSELLAPLGFTLTEADSGTACLAAVAASPPDILLMDIAMPGMDGWEVCRLLREHGYRDLPIIIISANVFDPIARQSESLYRNDFIAKPFMMKELLAKLKLHLGIEWIAAPKPELASAQTLRLIPPRAALAKLVELGDIGYVKGIVALLSYIENKNALFAPFCTKLKTLVERFCLPEYSNRLKEWMHDDVDHV